MWPISTSSFSSQSDVWTWLSASVPRLMAVTKCSPPLVRTGVTSCPAFFSSRTSSSDLYAAIPPPTMRSTRAMGSAYHKQQQCAERRADDSDHRITPPILLLDDRDVGQRRRWRGRAMRRIIFVEPIDQLGDFLERADQLDDSVGIISLGTKL